MLAKESGVRMTYERKFVYIGRLFLMQKKAAFCLNGRCKNRIAFANLFVVRRNSIPKKGGREA